MSIWTKFTTVTIKINIKEDIKFRLLVLECAFNRDCAAKMFLSFLYHKWFDDIILLL